MKNSQHIIKLIKQAGIIAVLPGDIPLQIITEMGDALLASPVVAVEVQLDNGNGTQMIADLRQRAHKNMIIGAGHVESLTTAQNTIAAGAQIISSDRLDFEVMTFCKEHDVLYVPGVISVLAAQAVWQAGGNIVRLRTGGPHGPDYVSAMQQAIPGLQVLVSGDISTDQVALYAKAGADGIFVEHDLYAGEAQPLANLISKARLLQKEWDAGLSQRMS